jgi:hypothetical protein
MSITNGVFDALPREAQAHIIGLEERLRRVTAERDSWKERFYDLTGFVHDPDESIGRERAYERVAE